MVLNLEMSTLLFLEAINEGDSVKTTGVADEVQTAERDEGGRTIV